uniref:Retrovirus-related Pol polyprotein from transposon TNT 1-94 n=1 Tax=Aegilops tauschii TaxID=37682 RepID=M8CWP3_AEGTA
MHLHGRYPKETVGYTFYHRSEGKIFVAKNGSFLEKEFLSKEVSGRKVELDEVIVPSPELKSSTSQKSVPVIPTPISEEANDDDHETSDHVTTEPRRSTRVRSAPEWYSNPVLEVKLLDHDEPMNYEEAMMSPDSAKWLEAMKSEM